MSAVGKCSVFGCSATSSETVSLHRLPKDAKQRNIWIERCYRTDNFNTATARICSKHFKEADYERDFQSELLGTRKRRILKPGSLPQPRIKKSPPKRLLSIARSQQQEARDLVHVALAPPPCKIPRVESSSTALAEPQKTACVQTDTPSSTEKEEIIRLRCQLAMQKKKICELEKENDELTKAAAQNKENNLRNKLRGVFSESQLQRIVTGKRSGWTTEDYYNAVTLRSLSKKAYIYLKKKDYPLPSLSSLYSWARRFSCAPGLLDSALSLMKHYLAGRSEMDRCIVISFDEMSVTKCVEWDETLDCVRGPHRNVQLVMVRGLFSNFKQPIYYGFDTAMQTALFRDIVQSVEQSGGLVVACVSDMGATNRHFWKSLTVSETAPFIIHPFDMTRKIYFFADVPHLLKLLRNHTMDSCFAVDGVILNKALFESLLAQDHGELKLAFKLTQEHLDVKQSARQNVRKAAQVFSNTTATAMEFFYPDRQREASLIRLINSAFDVMNSRTPRNKNPIAGAFGTHISSQLSVLAQMAGVISRGRVGKRTILLPFQKGFLMSIRAVQLLLPHVQKTYAASYILTHRLNQDFLENAFSQVRAMGGSYDHPTPIEMKHRIRWLFLGVRSKCFTESSVEADSAAAVPIVKELVALNQSSSAVPSTTKLYRDAASTSATEASSVAPAKINNASKVLLLESDEVTAAEAQVVRYIAGYVAFKLRFSNPTLGSVAGIDRLKARFQKDWIGLLSRGGLRVPSLEWFTACQQLENYFRESNQGGIRRSQTMSSLLQHAPRIPGAPFAAIRMYLRSRVRARIRIMNLKLSLTNCRKKAKKMKKLTS